MRETGLVHALLGLADRNAIAGHPVVGPGLEGLVIENLMSAAPDRTEASLYRTAAGAEIDLLLELPGGQGLWAFEIKRGLAAGVDRGFHHARAVVQPDRAFVIHSGETHYPMSQEVEAIGVHELAGMLAEL